MSNESFRHLRAVLLFAVGLLASGCWILRDVGIDLPDERELKLNGLQELSLRWYEDNYRNPILAIVLPSSRVPCPRVSDSVSVTVAGHQLRRKSSGGPFYPKDSFTARGCVDYAEWWVPFEVAPDAEVVFSDGERVIKASSPELFVRRRLTTPARWKLGSTTEVALEPASDRILRARVAFSMGRSGRPPIEITEQALQYEGNKIRFPVPALEPGERFFFVQVFEYEGQVQRCEGVPRCTMKHSRIQELSTEVVR